jgi:hypothetical protein
MSFDTSVRPGRQGAGGSDDLTSVVYINGGGPEPEQCGRASPPTRTGWTSADAVTLAESAL